MNWLLLKNSLLVGGLSTLLAVGLGLAAALWLGGLGSRWRNLFLALAIVALALPPFLVTNCWIHYLGHAGVWRGWLPFDIFSLGGTVWILSLLLWPIPLLATLSAWQKLQPSQFESDPAVSGWPLIQALLLPSARSALLQAAVLTFVLALNNFAVPAILQVKVLPDEAWIRFNTNFDSLGALRLSLPLIIAPLLLLVWLARRGAPWPRIEASVSPRLFRQQLGSGWFMLCGILSIALCLISVGLPLVQLLSAGRTWTELPGALAAGQSAIWNSFRFAAIAASAIIFLSVIQKPHERLGQHRSKSFNSLLQPLLWLPFLAPGVLLGIGLIALFNHQWSVFFYQSAGIVILALMIRYFALGWSTSHHALNAADPDLTDVARLEGATRWQILRHVLWPQISRQLAAAWYIVFLICLWDAESIILIIPPGNETLALRVFNLLHYGHNAQVNALCLTLLFIAITPLLLWNTSLMIRNCKLRIAHHPSRITLLIPGALLLLAGCTPPSTTNETSIHSRFFDHVQIVGTRGVGVGQLNKPRSVALDSQNNLFVVDMTGRVQKFSPQGESLFSWQMPQTDLGKPKGMCRDRAGNIIVVEPHYQRVNHFSPEGKLLAQWGQRGTNEGQFTLPRAVAVNSQGEIFVSEYGTKERVQKFQVSNRQEAETEISTSPPPIDPVTKRKDSPIAATTSARLIIAFGHAGNAPGEFNRPEGLCVDSQDRLYVADSCNHRIQIFSSDGKFIRAYGKAGSGLGELSYPYGICVDSAGRQYVCEFGNSRIQIFDAQDRPIEIIGRAGPAPGEFGNPWGVALDSSGDLCVADSQNHRVQKFIRKQSVVSAQWSVAAAEQLTPGDRLRTPDFIFRISD